MNISSNPSVGYIALLLFLIGLFLFVSGLNIIKIEKITVTTGFKTWVVGLILMMAGVIVGVKEEILNEPLISQEKTENKNNNYLSNWTPWEKGKGNSSITIDNNVFYTESNSISIINKGEGVADYDYGSGICQEIKTDNYLGKRISYSAYMKTKELEKDTYIYAISGEIYPSKGIKSKDKKTTRDWTYMKIVFDIPKNHNEDTISLCFSLWDNGQVWIDDIKWETVDSTVPITYSTPLNEPVLQESTNHSAEKLDITELKDLGKQKLKEKKYNAAIEAFKQVLTYQPNDVATLKNIARSYLSNKQLDSALESVNLAININSSDWESYQIQGWIYEDRAQKDKAIVAYEKAFSINPNETLVSQQLADNYRKDQRYDLALKHINIRIKDNPYNISYAYYIRALTYRDMGKYTESIADFKKCIDVEPEGYGKICRENLGCDRK